MNLSEIVEIKDLYSYSNTDNLTFEVNEYLENGWKLLETYKVDYGDPYENREAIHYVLGLDAETKNNLKSSQD